VICDVHEALAEDVDRAVDAAEAAFRAWRDLSANERAAPMARLSQLILRDTQELAELDAVAMGKSGFPFDISVASNRDRKWILLTSYFRPVQLLKKMDVPACAGVFNYFAGSAYHVLGESSLNSADFLNVSLRQPYGVVGLIIPWNVRIPIFP
jgi:aldehyde dehydrogenase (NAD+)